jgi:hypothetical protein
MPLGSTRFHGLLGSRDRLLLLAQAGRLRRLWVVVDAVDAVRPSAQSTDPIDPTPT